MRPLAILVLTAFSLSLAHPAIASSERAHVGPGWVAFELGHADTSVLSLSMYGASSGAIMAIRVLDADGKSMAGITGTYTSQNAVVSIDGGPDPAQRRSVEVFSPGSGDLEETLSGAPFTGFVLFWAAGNVDGMDVSVATSTSGFSRQIGEGTRWFYEEADGLDSDGHAVVDLGPLHAAFQDHGTLDIDIMDHFIGAIGKQGSGQGTQVVTLESSGDTRTCPCTFTSFSGPGALGSGPKKITSDAQRIESNFATVIIAGVDVPWPLR